MDLEKQMLLPLDENLKRIVLRSLQMYRDELLISDWKINKSLYHLIVQEEVALIEKVLSEIKKRWEEVIMAETFTHLYQPFRTKQVKESLEQIQKKPSSTIKGFTTQGQLVEIMYKEEVGFSLLMDGKQICQANSLDLASNLFISIVD